MDRSTIRHFGQALTDELGRRWCQVFHWQSDRYPHGMLRCRRCSRWLS